MELGSAYGKVVLDASGVAKGIGVAKQAFRDGARAAEEFGGKLDREAGKIREGFKSALPESVGGEIGRAFGGALAAGVAGAIPLLIAQVKAFADEGVKIGKMQQSTGMAAKDLSALSQIAKENEVDLNALSMSLSRFSRVMADTKGPTANVKAELMMLADQFKNMEDGPAKAELAFQKFGRAGEAMIPILNLGGEGIRKYTAELDKAGALMDGKMVEAANRFDDAMDRLSRGGEAFKISVGSAFVPAIADMVEMLNHLGETIHYVDALSGALMQLANNNPALLMQLINSSQAMQKMSRESVILQLALSGNFSAAMNFARGAEIAAQGARDAGNAAGAAVGPVNALTAAFGNAQVAYGAARRASDANQRWMNSQAATSAKLAERESKDFDRAEQQRMKIQQYNKSAAQSTRDVERESAKLGRTLTYSTKATWDANAAVGDYTKSLGGGGGGGAAGATDALAKTTDALADAQERLNARTASIEGAMSSSLKPMSDMDKFQQAWAIATGKTTIQELEQEAAVKSVMKALEDKKISQEDALATLVALRQGLLDAKDAMSQTGGSGDQFLKDVESIRTLTDGAIKKVEDLGIGVNNLPNNKDVRIGIRVVGKEDVMDAHDRMAAMRDRDITLRVNVVGLQDLKDIGAGLRPVGTPGGFAPGSTTTTPAPSPGVTTTTPATPLDDGAKRGTQSVTNVNVGGELVATVMTDSQGGVNVMRSNKRRSWRA
jgi:hypothetical protein